MQYKVGAWGSAGLPNALRNEARCQPPTVCGLTMTSTSFAGWTLRNRKLQFEVTDPLVGQGRHRRPAPVHPRPLRFRCIAASRPSTTRCSLIRRYLQRNRFRSNSILPLLSSRKAGTKCRGPRRRISGSRERRDRRSEAGRHGDRFPCRPIFGDWDLSYIYSYQSGPPIAFGDVLLTGSAKDIPLSSAARTAAQWFNINAFNRVSSQQLANNLITLSPTFAGIRAAPTTRPTAR